MFPFKYVLTHRNLQKFWVRAALRLGQFCENFNNTHEINRWLPSGRCDYIYIEDITCPRVDMNFIFEWSTRYLTSERSERVRYRVDHEKIKFISISGHVIFCLLYKHQWNTKPFYFNIFNGLKGAQSRYSELFWASTKLPLNWRKPENNTLQR